ncbi:MAG: AAA family ATPase [Oscillospiraceae bacterium]|nr:AAA family ATPase [Oscillospiraceae bacterium]
MNIAQAKEQVFNTLRAYSAKNEYGEYILEPDQQRPIFLMGPPGIGKTAIVRQAAEEMGLGLVSYSITHHTRQSALGLPKIIHKQYGNESIDVTEYTMSEIIASVYDCMETSGCREGILFLDEVNCASETLTPSMLQFLQFKTFGSHKVPDGWIVVTAGNPVSYNRNAKEFDVVTWDRLKRVDIEPDYEAWKAYAYQTRVHASILSYLEVRKENFYKIEETVNGKRFVTARGWSDLSTIIRLYEEQGIAVDKALIGQYIQDDKIADDFASYYDLFNKYRSDYKLNEILEGKAPDEIRKRAADAPFDEKLALLGLLLDKVNESISEVIRQEDVVTELRNVLKEVKEGKGFSEVTDHEEEVYTRFRRMGVLSADARAKYDAVLAFLRKHSGKAFDEIRADYEQLVSDMKEKAKGAGAKLDALFSFAEDVWGEGQEILILVTELTIGYYSSRFIARYGCEGYYKYSESLKFYERKLEILKKGESIWA